MPDVKCPVCMELMTATAYSASLDEEHLALYECGCGNKINVSMYKLMKGTVNVRKI